MELARVWVSSIGLGTPLPANLGVLESPWYLSRGLSPTRS